MIRKVDLPFVSDLISAIDHGIKAYEDFTQDIPDLLGGIYNSGAALFDIGSNALPAKTIFKLGKLLYGFFDIGYGMYQDRAEQLK
jgi:hypothetical protein